MITIEAAQRGLLLLGLGAWIASLWQDIPAAGARALGASLLIVAALAGKSSLGGPAMVAFRALAPLALAAVASLVWTADLQRTVEGIVTLGLGVISVVCSASTRTSAFSWALRRLLVIVIVATLAMTGSSLLAERVRGPFENPNSLGATLLLLAPFAWTSRSRLDRAAAAVAGGLTVLTGSRAATLGFLAAMSFLLLSGGRSTLVRTAARRVVVVAALILCAAFLITGLSSEEVAGDSLAHDQSLDVLRRRNSRHETWSASIAAIKAKPLLGYGYRVEPSFSASSMLAVLQQLGLVGAAALALPLVRVARRWRPSQPAAAAVVLGGVCNAFFESWAIAGGSALFVLFWSAALAASPLSHRLLPSVTYPLQAYSASSP